ncbi:MAG: phage tail protein, partial [Smithellaceae bacterium]
MPVTPTYPGVYIEEVPSGVRTITGVSTSVTAFVGSTKRGPINKAIRILSYADFERAFGGLDAGSKLSYAVRQFYLNGGSDAWIVRLAKNASAAQKILT